MSQAEAAPRTTQSTPQIPRWTFTLLAVACGLIVANLYYAQPLAGPIAAELGMSPATTGLIVTLSQLGYFAGLLLLVPLGDVMENRRLIATLLALCAVALAVVAASTTAAMFLSGILGVGLLAVGAQLLVPLAAHFAPAATRGQAVGTVMSGLQLGIMLARPTASLITAISSWHVVFWLSAISTAVLAVVLARSLPARRPAPGLGYGRLLASMGRLAMTTPILRRRSLYHWTLFGGFSVFWTTVPLYLASPVYHLGQTGIALFALAGVAGAVAAPLAGRLADRGFSRLATFVAMLLVSAAFLLARVGLWADHRALGIGVMTAAAIVLDFGLSANLVLGQRAIFSLGADIRSRLNGLYIATFFRGGAAGSAVGAWVYATGGWSAVTWLGAALPIPVLLYALTERRRPRFSG